MNNSIVLYTIENDIKAQEIAKFLDIEVVSDLEKAKSYELFYKYENKTLSLASDNLEMYCDFSKLLKRIKPSNLKEELLVKACKIKDKDSPIVIDATAGLGEDSFLLAASGCKVKLYEYNPYIYVLLKNGVERAKEDEKLKDIVSNMEVFNENSIEALNQINEEIDVVYLDPMFPEKQKSSLIKKKFQLLHHLEKPCDNPIELLEAAKKAKPKKIVIKRPIKAENLANEKPSHSYKGKAIRFDCLVNIK